MEETLSVQGIATRHRHEGAGPEVVVLHGWGASIEAVGPIVAALRDVCSVHAVDLPGFGASDPPPVPWASEDYSAWVDDLIGSLGLERVSIVGHSHGGRVALCLAARRPELVERLLLVDAAGIRAPRTVGWYRRVAVAKLAKHVLNRLGAPGRALGRRLVGQVASTDYAAAQGVMRPTLVRCVNDDLTDLLASVRAPTLLVWGDADADTPLSDGETMERLIPDAGLVVFEGAGHFSYADQPQRFARIARHFLARADAPIAEGSAAG